MLSSPTQLQFPKNKEERIGALFLGLEKEKVYSLAMNFDLGRSPMGGRLVKPYEGHLEQRKGAHTLSEPT